MICLLNRWTHVEMIPCMAGNQPTYEGKVLYYLVYLVDIPWQTKMLWARAIPMVVMGNSRQVVL